MPPAAGTPSPKPRVKVDPAPGSLRTARLTSCSSASRRVSARPRPVPVCRRDVGESICSNGSKIRPRCSAAMPMPLSHTSRTRPSSCGRARMPIRPPAGVNFMAFDNRFSSIWRTRSGSARTDGSDSGTSTLRLSRCAAACSRTMAAASSTATARSRSASSAVSLSASDLASSRMSPTRASRWRPLASICETSWACLSVSGPWSWRDRTVERPMTALSGARSSWPTSASLDVAERSPRTASVSPEVMAVTRVAFLAYTCVDECITRRLQNAG